MGKPPYVIWYVLAVWDGKNTVYIWQCTFAVWYHGTMSWMYYTAKFAWWYSMLQYKVRKKGSNRSYEYHLERAYISAIGKCSKIQALRTDGQTDRQTVRQTDKFAFFYRNRDAVLQTENKR